jgi:hypothetical protein
MAICKIQSSQPYVRLETFASTGELRVCTFFPGSIERGKQRALQVFNPVWSSARTRYTKEYLVGISSSGGGPDEDDPFGRKDIPSPRLIHDRTPLLRARIWRPGWRVKRKVRDPRSVVMVWRTPRSSRDCAWYFRSRMASDPGMPRLDDIMSPLEVTQGSWQAIQSRSGCVTMLVKRAKSCSTTGSVLTNLAWGSDF